MYSPLFAAAEKTWIGIFTNPKDILPFHIALAGIRILPESFGAYDIIMAVEKQLGALAMIIFWIVVSS